MGSFLPLDYQEQRPGVSDLRILWRESAASVPKLRATPMVAVKIEKLKINETFSIGKIRVSALNAVTISISVQTFLTTVSALRSERRVAFLNRTCAGVTERALDMEGPQIPLALGAGPRLTRRR